jgi:hypothetical protein
MSSGCKIRRMGLRVFQQFEIWNLKNRKGHTQQKGPR